VSSSICGDNIKMDLTEIMCGLAVLTGLAQDKEHFCILLKTWNYLTG
jgi:hypothetical protein